MWGTHKLSEFGVLSGRAGVTIASQPDPTGSRTLFGHGLLLLSSVSLALESSLSGDSD
ncbi:hypothetical protein [Halorussus halophilus]|uniref:hypothetical protein n=1 Tax=Halorussus halophilus TaxID=2650975 RepID=UPI0017882309|nr:hypothetical protein [Halorussus halophilus]